MPEAKFINNNNGQKYLCNICSDEIPNDKIVGLKCNPKKHIFCYDCINDWYVQLNKKKKNSNYPILNICPICRKKGGLLPVYNDTKPIKNIHILKSVSNKICGVKLKSNDNFCKFIGKFDGYCKKHSNQTIINTCGVKLKSKEGFCESVGKECYGGFCGKHKLKENILIV